MEATPANANTDTGGSTVRKLDSIPVPPLPAATEAPVRKRQGATDVCVRTDSPENTAKWGSQTLVPPALV